MYTDVDLRRGKRVYQPWLRDLSKDPIIYRMYLHDDLYKVVVRLERILQ